MNVNSPDVSRIRAAVGEKDLNFRCLKDIVVRGENPTGRVDDQSRHRAGRAPEVLGRECEHGLARGRGAFRGR